MFYMVDIGAVRLTEEDKVIPQRLTTIVKTRLHKLNERGILRVQCLLPLEDEVRTFGIVRSLCIILTSYRINRRHPTTHSSVHGNHGHQVTLCSQ